MDSNDQQAIGGLFDRLATVERQAPSRDAEAEAFIREQIARQPASPYYMAQTIVVQEQALNAAQAHIEQLEQEIASSPSAGGGLFGTLFGGGQPRRSGGVGVPRVGRTGAPLAGGQQPFRQDPYGRGTAGGGFLAGAAQTAMGVAGGVLLGNAIAGMFGGEAQAAEPAPQADDAAADDGSFDSGGDFDDI